MKSIILFLIAGVMIIGLTADAVDSSSVVYKGIASWYSEKDPGISDTTANMERFDDTALTCTIWNMPFNTILKVTNLENGRQVCVRVNDRGPAERLVKKGRIVDLTKRAFSMLDDLDKGLIHVSVEVLSVLKDVF